MLGAGVSSMELKPFARNWTINRWDGRCVSAPPVGLWAPTVPFGNQWPPCTGWCPGSSLIHWWGRGGLGFVCPLESGGCWFSTQPAAHAASTDGCRNASPWNAQIPQSEVGREGLTRSKVFNNNVSCGLTSVSEMTSVWQFHKPLMGPWWLWGQNWGRYGYSQSVQLCCWKPLLAHPWLPAADALLHCEGIQKRPPSEGTEKKKTVNRAQVWSKKRT